MKRTLSLTLSIDLPDSAVLAPHMADALAQYVSDLRMGRLGRNVYEFMRAENGVEIAAVAGSEDDEARPAVFVTPAPHPDDIEAIDQLHAMQAAGCEVHIMPRVGGPTTPLPEWQPRKPVPIDPAMQQQYRKVEGLTTPLKGAPLAGLLGNRLSLSPAPIDSDHPRSYELRREPSPSANPTRRFVGRRWDY